ncbi:hypothetical protein N1851_006964 [Merluccius polli]|uniref:Uncharacterized protein n=1 Tax=Merluccius polli TaxID=89951 RepID=A0AA47N3N6_MERPO|nr:hypothetical protein N1851_006964 [Merluccius polli]
MAASTDVIQMRAAIEQVLAELECIPSLKYEQKALEAFLGGKDAIALLPIDIYTTLDASSALLANGVERPHMAAILLQAARSPSCWCFPCFACSTMEEFGEYDVIWWTS